MDFKGLRLVSFGFYLFLFYFYYFFLNFCVLATPRRIVCFWFLPLRLHGKFSFSFFRDGNIFKNSVQLLFLHCSSCCLLFIAESEARLKGWWLLGLFRVLGQLLKENGVPLGCGLFQVIGKVPLWAISTVSSYIGCPIFPAWSEMKASVKIDCLAPKPGTNPIKNRLAKMFVILQGFPDPELQSSLIWPFLWIYVDNFHPIYSALYNVACVSCIFVGFRMVNDLG